jgi:hypothetical protein
MSYIVYASPIIALSAILLIASTPDVFAGGPAVTVATNQ